MQECKACLARVSKSKAGLALHAKFNDPPIRLHHF